MVMVQSMVKEGTLWTNDIEWVKIRHLYKWVSSKLCNQAGDDLCPTPRGGRDQRRRGNIKVVEREATAGAHTRSGKRYTRSTNFRLYNSFIEG